MSESPDAARILIVDDEPIQIRVLSEALQGFDLRFATDGGRALNLALENEVDLILLDVVMPGIGGMEVLRWLKSEPRTAHIPVILVTAMSAEEDEQQGLALGAADYISKPVRPAILRARVQSQITLKRQRDLLEKLQPRDSLTGIANASRFEDELDRAWGRAQRRGGQLCLMQLALDHFDSYAAEYGQSPVDECLRRVAQALDGAFSRGDDLVARQGDGGFTILLDGALDPAQVRRALATVATLEIPHVRSPSSPFVSASIGALSTQVDSTASAADCLTRIARLLAEAQQAGGGQGLCLRLPEQTAHAVRLPESAAQLNNGNE